MTVRKLNQREIDSRIDEQNRILARFLQRVDIINDKTDKKVLYKIYTESANDWLTFLRRQTDLIDEQNIALTRQSSVNVEHIQLRILRAYHRILRLSQNVGIALTPNQKTMLLSEQDTLNASLIADENNIEENEEVLDGAGGGQNQPQSFNLSHPMNDAVVTSVIMSTSAPPSLQPSYASFTSETTTTTTVTSTQASDPFSTLVITSVPRFATSEQPTYHSAGYMPYTSFSFNQQVNPSLNIPPNDHQFFYDRDVDRNFSTSEAFGFSTTATTAELRTRPSEINHDGFYEHERQRRNSILNPSAPRFNPLRKESNPLNNFNNAGGAIRKPNNPMNVPLSRQNEFEDMQRNRNPNISNMFNQDNSSPKDLNINSNINSNFHDPTNEKFNLLLDAITKMAEGQASVTSALLQQTPR
jgi:hypothetical protein